MAWFKWFGKNEKRTVVRGRASGGGRRRDWNAAGDYSLLQDWASYDSGTINALLIAANDRIRTRARYAARNAPIAKRYIELAKRNVIGSAMRYKPLGNWRKDIRMVAAMEVHDQMLRQQSRAENFTASGSLSRGEFENLILEQVVRDGEAIIIRQRGAKNKTGYTLRIIDPSLLATQLSTGQSATGDLGQKTGERIIAGVGVDRDYRPIAYYFNGSGRADSVAEVLTNINKVTRVPAADVLHLFKPHYANQVRGYSWFAPVLVRIEMLRRYEETAMNAARQGAAKHITLETNKGAGFAGEGTEDEGGMPEVSMSGEDLTVLATGEKLIFNDPVYPHELYKDFVDTSQTNVASGLDSAPVGMTGNWAGINFSAGQLMSLDERDKWETLQQWISDRFSRWWHEDWIRYCMLTNQFRTPDGRAVAPTIMLRLLHCDWEGKRFAPIDAVKAATAQKIRIESGVSSLSQEIRNNGGDPDQVFEERKYEKEQGFLPESEKSGIMPTPPDKAEDD